MIESERPLITVIVGCYNHAQYVEQCLDSVRRQTYANVQLVVFDDGSTDDSVQVIERWIAAHGAHCTFIRDGDNLGLCQRLNQALLIAAGEYVAMTAADDLWLPEKLERQVAILQAAPEHVALVYSDAYQMDAQGADLRRTYLEHCQAVPAPEGNVFRKLLEGNFVLAQTALWRRTCYEKVGLYDESISTEDWDMWLRVSARFSFVFSPYVSAKYRIVQTSLWHELNSRPEGRRKLYSSYFRIYRKSLRLAGDDAIARKLSLDGLHAAAINMYKSGCDDASAAILEAWHLAPRLKTLLFGLAAMTGIRYESLKSLVRSFRSCRKPA